MNTNGIRTNQAHRKTALVLGGGGSRGAYEVGVWQALKEMGIRIDMVYGTSVGAINAAMVAMGDVDITAELWKELETDMVFDMSPDSKPIDYVKEIVVDHGAGTGPLKGLLDKYVDEKAVRESGLEFGITTVSVPGFVPHHLRIGDIPSEKLTDYIMASASAYPALHAYEIDGKTYVDGGYNDVLPVGMAVDDGAEIIIAVDLDGYGPVNKKNLERAKDLTYIKSRIDLGFQFLFDRTNTARIMKLGYLDCLKAFDVLEGDWLSFSKGTFDRSTMKMADCVGEIFRMDTPVIYTKQIFMERIAEIIEKDGDLADKLNQLVSIKSIKGKVDFAQNEGLKDSQKDIRAEKLLCYAACDDIKKYGTDSIFMKRTAQKIIPKVVSAAKFLVKNELV